eukprot:gi/632957868/ref/XP_007894720.1/ PREDICTED: vitronectin-like isoform X1 [Callorhinchus milii]
MRWLAVVILLGSFVCPASTDQGSCVGRCADGFNETHKCQCDNLCHFYKSCCVDYSTVCRRAHGDVFTVPEDEHDDDDDEFDDDINGGVTGSSLPFVSLRNTTEPETATELAMALEPETATELAMALEPETATELAMILEPETATELAMALEPETATELTMILELETATELAMTPEPETATELAMALEPETATELAMALEPETATELAMILEPETATELAMALEPETATELTMILEPETATELAMTLEPETATELAMTPEPETATELAMTLEPETATELAMIREPETATELAMTLEPETATELAMALKPGPKPNDLCSDKESFDAFTDLKNGSIFAFRGEYFYELDSYSFREGYPKRTSDVWGIPGPIDTAFTRINCEGKTYIFKGDSYWRFDDGKLDPGFPNKIKLGFPGIPSNLDASFALPASNINGNERAYFFKGNQYWQYVFKHQPKRSECLKTSESVPFQRYAITMLDPWESLYELLFQSSASGGNVYGAIGPGSVSRDWLGLPSNVDAAMSGKLLMISQDVPDRQRGRKKPKKRKGKKKKHHSSSMEFYFHKRPGLVPSQSIYFFAQDEYYRVDLESKQVALVDPPYPRSIARYWFKCRESE